MQFIRLLALALAPGSALGFFSFSKPETASPKCVPWIVDQVDTGTQICIDKIDGLLKKVYIKFPEVVGNTYDKVMLDYNCWDPVARNPAFYPYQSPWTGCSISHDGKTAECTIATALYMCNDCKDNINIVAHAEMTKPDGTAAIGSATGKCIPDLTGSCPEWYMFWEAQLLCAGDHASHEYSTPVYEPFGVATSSHHDGHHTPPPTSTPVSGTVEPYGQCGGEGWTGETTCTEGWNCVWQNQFYSQCVEGTGAPPSSPGGQAEPWGQCGGTGWTGATACTDGWSCVWQSELYSQCLQNQVQGGQCGGTGYSGVTQCQADYTCHVVSDTYHVCKYTGPDTQIQGFQCGGNDWWGKTVCGPDLECYVQDDTYSVCRSTLLAGRGEQCGGKNMWGQPYWGPSECEAGHECHIRDEFFHVCRSTDIQTSGGQCGGTDPVTNRFWWGPYQCEAPTECSYVTWDRWECQAPVAPGGDPASIEAGPGAQCGGDGWMGATTCAEGYYCRVFTSKYHECVPLGSGTGLQCGGIGWTGATTCPAGYTCKVFTSKYSECIADGDLPSYEFGGGLVTTQCATEPYVMICTATPEL